MKPVVSRSHSAISVVNALATGRGSAIGIDIWCSVKVRFISQPIGKKGKVIVDSPVRDHHHLIQKCVEHAEKSFKLLIPEGKALSLSISSDIPPAVGLKSSSAISVAAVEAMAKLSGSEADYKSILRASCKASKESGASLTGAYDDASACLLGGFVLTDNKRFRLLKHSRIPDSLGRLVLLRVPSRQQRFTSSVDTSAYSSFKPESMKAFEFARRGEIAQAMMLNSIIQCSALGYSFEPVSSAISAGASAAGVSGKGPAVFALCNSEKVADGIEGRWREETKEHLRIIRTQIVQPERVVAT